VRGGAALPGGPVPFAPAGDGARMPETGVTVWPAPPWTLKNGVLGFVDAFGPAGIDGWARSIETPSAPAVFDIWEEGACIASLRADGWRKDLEETRQGDGRWGLAASMPASLQDGRVHRLQVRHPDGSAALDHAVIVHVPPRPDRPDLPGQADPPVGEDVQPNKVRPPRADAQDGVMFSIIVNFYNMPREAARTLTSLSRLYQARYRRVALRGAVRR